MNQESPIEPSPEPRVPVLGSLPPSALVLLGIVSVQVGAALAKGLFSTIGPWATVALRLFFAAVVLLAWARPSFRLSRRAWGVVAAYGLVLGVMNLCFYLSLSRVPLGLAVTIEFLGPLAVSLLGSRRALDALWAVLAGAGVVLLMEGKANLDPLGFFLALGAGVCWGLYILLSAALGRHTTETQGLALGLGLAALIVVPFGLADHPSALVQPVVLLVGLGVSLLSSVVPYTLELEALRTMPPRVFGILMSVEPAMAALIGLVLLGESLQGTQWIAVICVVVASAGATLGSKKPPG